MVFIYIIYNTRKASNIGQVIELIGKNREVYVLTLS